MYHLPNYKSYKRYKIGPTSTQLWSWWLSYQNMIYILLKSSTDELSNELNLDNFKMIQNEI